MFHQNERALKGILGQIHPSFIQDVLKPSLSCVSHTQQTAYFPWNIVCMCKSSYFICHHPLLFLGGFSTELLGNSQDWVKPMWIHPLLLRVGDLPWNSPPQLWPVTSGFWINRYEMAIRLIHSCALLPVPRFILRAVQIYFGQTGRLEFVFNQVI